MNDDSVEVERLPETEALNFGRYRNIVILTGAGVSVASGIPPFRGPGGLWNDPNVERFAHRESLDDDPEGAWKFFALLRSAALKARPNAAHQALVRLEQSLRPDQSFLLITQNVDGLHQRAGSRQVAEIHGSILRTRCSNFDCDLKSFEDAGIHTDKKPICPRCGSILRPDLVLFGEQCILDAEWAVKMALRKVDLFVAVGTSGTVYPANGYARSARYVGAETVYINLEPLEGGDGTFDRSILGKAEEVLPRIVRGGEQ
jgi:NAD-dependent deacetylase